MPDNTPGNWLTENWKLLSGITTAFLASLGLAYKVGQDRRGVGADISELQSDVSKLKDNQLKILKSIPRNVMDGKDTLITMAECELKRANCSVHVATENLIESNIIIRQALSLVILHNKEIPLEDRDKTIAKLIE